MWNYVLNIPIGFRSKNCIGDRISRRNILIIINQISKTIHEYHYLLCNTRPAFKHINSVITTRRRVARKSAATISTKR